MEFLYLHVDPKGYKIKGYLEHLGVNDGGDSIDNRIDVGLGDRSADEHRVDGGGLADVLILSISGFRDDELFNHI